MVSGDRREPRNDEPFAYRLLEVIVRELTEVDLLPGRAGEVDTITINRDGPPPAVSRGDGESNDAKGRKGGTPILRWGPREAARAHSA